MLQVGAKLEAFDDTLVHRRLEDAVAALAVPLGHVHRNVRVAQKVFRLRRLELLADEADADASAGKDVLAVDLHGHVERAQDPGRRVCRILGSADAVEQDGELVAAEARNRVGRPHCDPEPRPTSCSTSSPAA